MTQKKFTLFSRRKTVTRHWKDYDTMHRAIHDVSGIFRAILLEMLDRPYSRHDMRLFIQQFSFKMRDKRTKHLQLRLKSDLEKAFKHEMITLKNGNYHLTDRGRELAEEVKAFLPGFFSWIMSPLTVTKITIVIHIILSIFKIGVSLLTKSASLLADGIDNTVDTLSAFLVHISVKIKKEKLITIFLIIAMIVSVAGIGLSSYNKIVNFEKIEHGILAFVMSLILGFVMLGLSAYQYYVGCSNNNLAILGQAVDSRNHFLTSLLVCAGIVLSGIAEISGVFFLNYADAAISIVIGIIILKGVFDLILECFRAEEGNIGIGHFIHSTIEKNKEKIVLDWLRVQLKFSPLKQNEIEKRYYSSFCKNRLQFTELTGLGYNPPSSEEIHYYLNRFTNKGMLLLDEEYYWLLV